MAQELVSSCVAIGWDAPSLWMSQHYQHVCSYMCQHISVCVCVCQHISVCVCMTTNYLPLDEVQKL